eukprot:TRINITY_DN16803_c0_g1_i1.p1 TRINITY_DN16803_c0_g1~~TRINITY_DN16803_c0_g1_i1.p1  ORF type:complete len:429 (+),score=157.35 TRINITY_DN16803_c0_g1_i1:107-1288(+)
MAAPDVSYKAAPLQQGCKVQIEDVAGMKDAWAAFKRPDDYDEDMDKVAGKEGTILHQHPSGAFTVVFEGKAAGLPKGEKVRWKFPPQAMKALDVVPVKKKAPRRKKKPAPTVALVETDIVFDELPPCEPEQIELDDIAPPPAIDPKEQARLRALEQEEEEFLVQEAALPVIPATFDTPQRPSEMPKDYSEVEDTLASPVPPPIVEAAPEEPPPAVEEDAADDDDEEAAFLRDLEQEEADEEAAFLAALDAGSSTASPAASSPAPELSTPMPARASRALGPEMVHKDETVTLRNVGLPKEAATASPADDGPRTQVIYDSQCRSVAANAAKYSQEDAVMPSPGTAPHAPDISSPKSTPAPPALDEDDDDSPQVQVITKSLNYTEMRAKYTHGVSS